jgi:hypothetical protein
MCRQIYQNRHLIDTETQTIGEISNSDSGDCMKNHLVSKEQCLSEMTELHLIKEQLRSAEDNIAYLSDRVQMYRVRWLEEYYHTNNLKYHMPSGIYVADLPQIPEGASSPISFPNYLYVDDE